MQKADRQLPVLRMQQCNGNLMQKPLSNNRFSVSFNVDSSTSEQHKGALILWQTLLTADIISLKAFK